jgi:Sigma-70 region 2
VCVVTCDGPVVVTGEVTVPEPGAGPGVWPAAFLARFARARWSLSSFTCPVIPVFLGSRAACLAIPYSICAFTPMLAFRSLMVNCRFCAAPAGPTPALNAYEQVVANLNNAIDALVVQFPEIQAPHSTTAKFVRTHQNVPLEFIAGAVGAVTNSPVLQAYNTFDANEGRDALQFISAFGPLQEKVSLLVIGPLGGGTIMKNERGASPSDGEILREFAAGTRDRFHLLVGRYERRVASYLKCYSGLDDRAEDITQETFLRLFLHVKRYGNVWPEGESIAPMLMLIAAHAAIDDLRKERARLQTDTKFVVFSVEEPAWAEAAASASAI